MKQGFTSVELLVTIFIAVMMVGGGYQLYNAVTLRNGRVRSMSEASSIAYSRLREFSDYVGTGTTCTSNTSGPISSTYLTTSTLPNRATGSPQSLVYRCKPLADNNVIRVTSIVYYDIPQREVVHATYIAQ